MQVCERRDVPEAGRVDRRRPIPNERLTYLEGRLGGQPRARDSPPVPVAAIRHVRWRGRTWSMSRSILSATIPGCSAWM
ncbi:MAG: hypothetical protein M3065_20400, partial [Actinomycetota bacterium]|nr:hypothetical protein [Actinomycetota bacterium]